MERVEYNTTIVRIVLNKYYIEDFSSLWGQFLFLILELRFEHKKKSYHKGNIYVPQWNLKL